MGITIRRATEDDLGVIASLSMDSFRDSPFHNAWFPARLRVKPDIEDRVEWAEYRMRRDFGKTHIMHIVAIDDASNNTTNSKDAGDVIVGCAEWISPVREVDGRTEEEKAEEMRIRKARGVPACMDLEATEAAGKEIEELMGRCEGAFEGKDKLKMWTLNSLTVDKQHQRKGIGRRLVQWGLEEAKRSGEGVWLIAGPEGAGLYEAMGFVEKGVGERTGEKQVVMIYER